MTEFDDLADMAVKVRRGLHWSAFLLICMVLILLIDLQLARSIARQSMALAELIDRNTPGRGDGQSKPVDAPADDHNHSRGGGGDHVDGSPGMAARDSAADDPLTDAVARHPAGRRKRPPGDGPGTGGDTGEAGGV